MAFTYELLQYVRLDLSTLMALIYEATDHLDHVYVPKTHFK